jgi:PIN domain nuclease of toxin-antitoxin system
MLDTHVWVRWLSPGSRPLAGDVLEAIDAADRVAVSSVSCWEVAYLHKRGRIGFGVDVSRWLDMALGGSDVDCVPVTREIAERAAALSDIHRDPADRFIIATALLTSSPLVTLDQTIRQYPEVKHLLS